MPQTNLTKSELSILTALSRGEGSSASFNTLRIASGLTIIGFRRVLHSMEDRSLLYRNELPGFGFTLTFKGAKAIGLTKSEAA